MGDLVTVTGRFELPDNAPGAPGCLVWTLVPGDLPDTSEPVTVLGGPVRVALDRDGSFSVDLRATDDAELTAHVEGALVYYVQRTLGGHTTAWSLAVPAPGPWDWTQLTPTPAPTDTVVVPVPGPTGPKGDQGDVGPQGPIGPQGPEGEWVQMTQAEYNTNPPAPDVLVVIVG